MFTLLTLPLARHVIPLDRSGWRFSLQSLPSSEGARPFNDPAFDDSTWANVLLPHDFMIDQPFSASANREHGYKPYAVGNYRLTFDAANLGPVVKLEFDGAMRATHVHLNGKLLGIHQSGYTPFSFDLTGLLQPTRNVLTVSCNATPPHHENVSELADSWWYDGGGLYRHVRLVVSGRLHVQQFGVHANASVVPGTIRPSATLAGADAARGLVTALTTLALHGAAPVAYTLHSEVLDAQGIIVATATPAEGTMSGAAPRDVRQRLSLAVAELWAVDSPTLYVRQVAA